MANAIDSNGNIIVNGGTIKIKANNPFQYFGEALFNKGTIIVNDKKITKITNQNDSKGQERHRQPREKE